MQTGPDDLGDANSREDARNYRETFTRQSASGIGFYIERWIPSPSRSGDFWDLFMTWLGAVILIGCLGAVAISKLLG